MDKHVQPRGVLFFREHRMNNLYQTEFPFVFRDKKCARIIRKEGKTHINKKHVV